MAKALFCEGCEKLEIAPWPRGRLAACCTGKCLKNEPRRVLSLDVAGAIPMIQRPAWCEKNLMKDE